MKSEDIQQSLQEQRDSLYNYLINQSISELFKEDYQLRQSGLVEIIGPEDKSTIEEIKKYSKDSSFDKPFEEKINSINLLDIDSIIEGFQNDFEKLFLFIRENNYEKDLQAIFIGYDYYGHSEGLISGLGKQDYPLLKVPRFINTEIDFSNPIFTNFNGINLKQAWVNCNEFEWTAAYFDIYYELQELFELHSRVLLNETLTMIKEDGKLNILNERPFTFYIHEHDCEVMTLFRMD